MCRQHVWSSDPTCCRRQVHASLQMVPLGHSSRRGRSCAVLLSTLALQLLRSQSKVTQCTALHGAMLLHHLTLLHHFLDIKSGAGCSASECCQQDIRTLSHKAVEPATLGEHNQLGFLTC